MRAEKRAGVLVRVSGSLLWPRARAGEVSSEPRPVKAGDGQGRAHALGWGMSRPTDLRPPPATRLYHEKLRVFQSTVKKTRAGIVLDSKTPALSLLRNFCADHLILCREAFGATPALHQNPALHKKSALSAPEVCPCGGWSPYSLICRGSGQPL
jgi:hypothetical protein